MGASGSLLLLDWQTPSLAAQIDSVSSGGINRTRKISVVEAQSCAMAETRNALRKFIDVLLVRKFTASEFMTLPPCALMAAAGGCLGRRSSEGASIGSHLNRDRTAVFIRHLAYPNHSW